MIFQLRCRNDGITHNGIISQAEQREQKTLREGEAA